MIRRYTRPEMGAVFAEDQRFHCMLQVEIAVAETQAELGLIPKDAAKAIRERASFDVRRIEEIEKTTKHDVIAFVSSVAEKVGEEGRYVHYGMTSSDVLDTALSLQIQAAGCVLMTSLDRLIAALKARSLAEAQTLCAGRTHGMHAEPTSFGMKLAGFWTELRRHRERVVSALERNAIGKLSGAVGTYSTQSYEVEVGVCRRLGLKPEDIATQVVPRDRHAELFVALSMLGGGLERVAVELRHLQRTELGEVIEAFTPGQKGSSAMPHKKNPISAENVTGLSRLLRGYALSALENIALWHERDISHSSVERVILPDAFIVADYATDRMATLIEGLYVDRERMLANMNLSGGSLMSSHLLLALVDTGLSREEAYAEVQRLAHGLKAGETLREAAGRDAKVSQRLSAAVLDDVFSGRKHRESIAAALARAGLTGGSSEVHVVTDGKVRK
jgi:adenylosuccinate lyase